jgi:hypothetical protein
VVREAFFSGRLVREQLRIINPFRTVISSDAGGGGFRRRYRCHLTPDQNRLATSAKTERTRSSRVSAAFSNANKCRRAGGAHGGARSPLKYWLFADFSG